MDENLENLYGEKAIVGNKDDASKVLEGRDVEIKTSNTQTVSVGHEEGDNKTSEHNQTAQQTEGTQEQAPEQKLESDIQTQLKAEQDARKDLAARGIDFNALASEYESKGTLSAESLAALEKAGYPKSVVDAYIAGMEATAARFEAQVYEYAGGKDAFLKMTQFVQGMGNEYVNAFNRVVETGDLTQIRLAINGFKAQMAAKYGTNNRTILGRSGDAAQTVQGFASRTEMVKAMSDPRYLRDPGYTKEVQNKTIRSTFIG